MVLIRAYNFKAYHQVFNNLVEIYNKYIYFFNFQAIQEIILREKIRIKIISIILVKVTKIFWVTIKNQRLELD